jgi:hypothetical protein
MDTTLLTVTILSMGMAAALSVIVWRLLRDERRRSDARVAALAAAADAPVASAFPPRRDAPRTDPAEALAKAGRRNDDELPLHEQPVTSGAMFVTAPEPTPWWNRLAVMAGVALVITSAVLFALAAKDRARAAGTESAATVAVSPGLELLSLRDSRDGDALTITGLVRNPRGAALRSRVAVTAYAFDEKGAFLASGRALLDVTALAGGDESPFLVTVPAAAAVARYRIGFRSEDGRVISHVDRRRSGPMAALRTDAGAVNW